jgi:polysaccharide biosynthesis/export protein
MTSQLPRVVLVLLLLVSAASRLAAADVRPTQAELEAAKQRHLQALQRNDFATAARLEAELRLLEARAGVTTFPAAAASATVPAASSYFSAPAGAPGTQLPSISSVFTPPAATPGTLTPVPVAPAATTVTKGKAPAPASPAPASKALPSQPAVTTPAAPAAPKMFAPPASPPRATNPPAAFTTITPAALEEPRPADVPPAVVELRAAQDALSKLEDFRMAESLTTRRGTALPGAASVVPPPSAVMAPSAGLTGTPDDYRRQLDDLTRRRTALQTEAERLARDSVDWEARYAAAKAELARLESQNQERGRLQAIRDEIARLNADATRLMQDMEAGRAEQDRRAREVLTRLDPTPSPGLSPHDRPPAAALPAMSFPLPVATPPAAAPPEKKGPPTFQTVGSSRPQRAVSEGNIVRTGRTGEDAAVIERELTQLNGKRELLTRESEDVQTKAALAQRELATAMRTGIQADVDRWTKESAALDERFRLVSAELAKVNTEMQGKMTAMRGAMGVTDPDTVNPGDVIRLIVAEDDSYNADYPVRRDGNISVKGVGRVEVGGRSISEAEAAVKKLLEESQLNKATVTLEFAKKAETGGGGLPPTSDQTVIIYLAGEFITPGPLKIPEGVAPTLITTIIRSGGITPSGDLTRTKLLRIENGQGAVEEVNVAAILSGNIPPTDIALNPGDIIMIPAFAPVVYVTGNVNKPGTLRLFQDETLTAYSAILRAGGFSRFANLKKCTVVRDLGNGEKIQMPLNVKEIQRGLAPDIVLQGKDIVVVPESFFSF